jgi:hypothetical protein
MRLIDMPEIHDHFVYDFYVCPIVRQAITLQQSVKMGQYLHLSDDDDDDDRSRPVDEDYNYLHMAQSTLDIINTSG